MANNKVKFLRGTSNEYAVAEKDNDAIYFTTDDGKLYIGNKEISGDGSLIIDDNMSDTSKNPVQNKIVNAALKSKADQTTVDNALAQKANLEYVNASLTGKSDIGHTHDDRYYTESEIDTKLNTKLNTSLKGAVSGLAELDSSGKVPSSQLPSYVDDVLEYTNKASFPATGESGKIYIAQDTNKTYRWSGSTYVEISPSLALGETSATAYRGDRGKVAYDHSQTAHAPSNAQANVIETIKVNGTALTPSSKAVDITVPSVGNGTITIKQAGTTKGTFTTNQSGNTTIELTDSNATYGVATSSELGLVKSGTDITVDSSGNVSVNDDSHNHVISNVDGLQSALDGKAAISHTHDDRYYTESEVDTKLNGKADISHTHSYLPLSGGILTGDVVLPITKSSADASLPVAGATMYITDIKNLSNYKTYLGSYTHSGTWYNLISTRHRNGSGDGINYGMYLRSPLTSSGDLTWGKQYGESLWQAERTILDSSNYTSYTVTKTGLGASGTWGINVTGSSASCSGNASTATALTTSAGSATQPVYFSGGKPVTCSYTLGKSVPSNAVFTDTNTWRGIQNNLTSDSTTDSLSAAQGKVLKGLVDGKAAASHTHNYAGSSSAGGSATTALKCTGNSATSSKLVSGSYTTISIATSDWSTNSSGGYVCTKSLSSAMAYTNFNIDVVLSTDQSAAKLQIESWNNVIADGEITQTTSSGSTTAFTFYAFTTKPSVALTVGIQGVS